jgi:phage-related protein
MDMASMFEGTAQETQMPNMPVLLFAENDVAPLLKWMDALDQTAQNKVIDRIEMLEERGEALTEPHAVVLDSGVRELQIRSDQISYAILYFALNGIALVSHGFLVRPRFRGGEISLAIDRKNSFLRNPNAHTYRGG